MVGDTLKKASESSGGKLVEIKDVSDTEYEYTFLLPNSYCKDTILGIQ